MSCIKFGTDGWRAVLGRDFNYDNVNKVINAVSLYIYNTSAYDKKIITGYDPRNKADEYAFYTAEKFSDFGFDVQISREITATPVLAYSALKEDAYAVMFTASHNPPEYLGIKFIPPYGGPADDDTVNKIAANLEKTFIPAGVSKKYKTVSFENEYIKHINNIIDFERIKKSGIKINYDGHHGAAGKLFLRILDEHGIKYNSLNIERDINFGGFMPDPKEEYLPALKKLCITTGLPGFSNDGDGDRYGVFDENGIFISPNDITAMLLKHLVINRHFSGKLAKTIGASDMLKFYAEKLGIEVIETAVGFKHLGAAMRSDDVIIAGEESGGLSFKGHIPEKDGIAAVLLIMEMTAYSGRKLFEIHSDFLKELNRQFVNRRIDIKLTSQQQADEIMKKAEQLKDIKGLKIVKTNKIDGLKLYLEDKSSILIRKSGTEPLLRIYFETSSAETAGRLEKAAREILLPAGI